MNRRHGGVVSRAGVAVVAALLLSGALYAGEPPGGATPEALVARMKQAAEKEDLPGIIACLSAKARTEMTMGLYMGATMLVAFSQMGVEMGGSMAESLGGEATAEDKQKAEKQLADARAQTAKLRDGYNALMAKHGLPAMPAEGEPEPEISEEQMGKAIEKLDAGVFAADVLGFMKTMPGSEEKPAQEASPVKVGAGVLTELAIDGETATGQLDGEPIRFVRENGRWFVDAEPEAAEPEPAEASAG